MVVLFYNIWFGSGQKSSGNASAREQQIPAGSLSQVMLKCRQPESICWINGLTQEGLLKIVPDFFREFSQRLVN